MTFENLSADGLDYLPCRYGKSKLMFRGPRKRLRQPYIAVMGGNETYGKFVELPLTELLEQKFGQTVVNFGHLNAGIDVFLNDAAVIDLCSAAELTVIEIPGAQNMSNRLYTVHPRRNDRFVKASKFMQTLYKDIDFAQFHYTRHMLSVLHECSAERYTMVQQELQAAWLARMKTLTAQINGPICLLWLSDRPVDDVGEVDPLAHGPLFVTRAMLDELAADIACLVEVVGSPDEIEAGQTRMIFSAMEEPVAREMLGPVVHESAARALHSAIAELL